MLTPDTREFQVINSTQYDSVCVCNAVLGCDITNARCPEFAARHQFTKAAPFAGTKAELTGIGVSKNAGGISVLPADRPKGEAVSGTMLNGPSFNAMLEIFLGFSGHVVEGVWRACELSAGIRALLNKLDLT